MADEPNPFAVLMKRVAQGDQQAAEEMYHKYHKAVTLVIRYRLDRSPELRTLHDSMDFLQEVWKDVFAHPEKLSEFATFEVFLKYLAGIASHKVANVRRKHAAKKRELHRTRHLSDPVIAAAAAGVTDPRPSADQQTASYEAWARWLGSLPRRHQHVVLLLRAGSSHQHVAAQLGCSVRSIERVVAKLRNVQPRVPQLCL